VIISCQENRSFDHYFGYAPQVQTAGLGPPRDYSQPDGMGGMVRPYEFTSLSTPDIDHSSAGWGKILMRRVVHARSPAPSERSSNTRHLPFSIKKWAST